MGKVTVYRAEIYHVGADAPKLHGRWVTRKGAEILRGTILEDTAIEIDEADLHGEQWTKEALNPNRYQMAWFKLTEDGVEVWSRQEALSEQDALRSFALAMDRKLEFAEENEVDRYVLTNTDTGKARWVRAA
jgi:hypothetical protein